MIEMNRKIEEFIKQLNNEDNEQKAFFQGKEKGRAKGIKEGSDETKREIAKKLKGKFTPEEISKITGVNLQTIYFLNGEAMANDLETIFRQVIDEVNRKYEQEAFEMGEQQGKNDGITEGIDKTKRDMAKKLKGKLSPEEISKVTGLKISNIETL